jgi:putative sterol carrier protein
MAARTAGRAGISPEKMAEWFRRHFQAEAARDLSAVIEVVLESAAATARVGLQVEGGRLKASLGGDAAPDARFIASAEDWADVLSGRANAEMLVMEGRIRIEGDESLAMKVRALFRRTG